VSLYIKHLSVSPTPCCLSWPVNLVCASARPPRSSGQRSGCIDLNLRKPSKLTFLSVRVGPHNKHTSYLLLLLREKKKLKDPFFFYKANRFQFLTSLPQPQLIPRAEDVHLDKSVMVENLVSEVRSVHLLLCLSFLSV